MIFGKMNPLRITNYTYTSCLGAGRSANWEALQAGCSGLKPCDFFQIKDLDTWIGEVANLDEALPARLADFDCRNNRLAWLALQQDGFFSAAEAAIARYGAARVGVFMGTSTSGIHQTELAYFENQDPLPNWYKYATTHNVSSVATFIQQALGTQGPMMAISTACSSSAKVFASAQRAITAGLCDAAIVGGVDSLCLTTLYGFHALQLVSPHKCQPFDRHRSGISIGEAGGFALLEKGSESGLYLLGYGESGDAYHMSSPHPDGAGAQLAMSAALRKAGLNTSEIDYINLHGTGTQANDSAEAKAVQQLFGNHTSASSTKGWTGHTLGAAGIVEACIGLEAIVHGHLPQNLHLQEADEGVTIALLKDPVPQPVTRVLSNSFGFGGSNCSLILGSL
ncbi:MAG: beta-ketoacyl-[acyl-carrier-protein] synthase family protein [Cellvibrio sp.]|uniref:beta-ketoacyl-[acyl-carrier-protein] synthase family protein n=1 Tax=Cellvibrio sp. TaxID=1965322 RepID=UPI00271A626E|nr:beta-ketoacyl-[acyl-carrier-protein] synthase family protein [Cellvibrio sp.]